MIEKVRDHADRQAGTILHNLNRRREGQEVTQSVNEEKPPLTPPLHEPTKMTD